MDGLIDNLAHGFSVAVSLNNLAALCRLTGRLTEARVFCERGLQIRESSLGPFHPDVAESLTELAVLEFTEKHYGEAKQLLQRSLANVRNASEASSPM